MISLGTGTTATTTTTRQILPLRVIYDTTTLSPTTVIAGS
jgi:hypothetical protein